MYSMGGLAEYCVVPANALTILPKSLPYTESAILGCAVFTAYGAMAHAAEIRPGDSVAVVGIGGVGSRYLYNICTCYMCVSSLLTCTDPKKQVVDLYVHNSDLQSLLLHGKASIT
jgi:D-arabinose 1-dehydrogenase-like Zn-dependent alcohol dehydrogenase